MKAITLYYFVQNNGDGSASPIFCCSKEFAEFESNRSIEGFCESTGSISVVHNGSLCGIRLRDVRTPFNVLFEILEESSYYDANHVSDLLDSLTKSGFFSKFFPDGKPDFAVMNEKEGETGYRDVRIVFNNYTTLVFTSKSVDYIKSELSRYFDEQIL